MKSRKYEERYEKKKNEKRNGGYFGPKQQCKILFAEVQIVIYGKLKSHVGDMGASHQTWGFGEQFPDFLLC